MQWLLGRGCEPHNSRPCPIADPTAGPLGPCAAARQARTGTSPASYCAHGSSMPPCGSVPAVSRRHRRPRGRRPGAAAPEHPPPVQQRALKPSPARHPPPQKYRICTQHTQSRAVEIEGSLVRFCQQCGRFHPTIDFDDGRRSCRRSLDRHKERRRAAEQQRLQAQGQ